MVNDISMDLNKNLNDYLDFYFSIDNPQFAVLINGKWGSGKTYFIKAQLNKWANKSEKGVTNRSILLKLSNIGKFFHYKTRQDSDSIVLKPIYISLYGITTQNEINLKIKEALNPLLYSKGVKILKNIIIGALKTATHINIDTDKDGKTDGKVSFDINLINILKSTDKKIKGDKILIFDDLERCNIKISELFGFINEFVEHFNCKAILLCDEDKICKKCEENKDSYEEFKEKLIGQTFIIQADVSNAINSFINRSTESVETEFLHSSSNLIKSVFSSSKIENLRILKQAILDFERFVKQFDSDILQHYQYIKFLNSLLGHFLLVYLEYKSGNQEISELDIYHFGNDKKEIESIIRSKYDNILDRFDVYNRMSVIEYKYIIEFINIGYSDSIGLNSSVRKNAFFRDSEPKDWEKLWYWEEIEDNEFYEIYTKVLSDFNDSKIFNPYILLHVVTILFSLIEKNIVEGNKSEIIKNYKRQFDSILENNKNEDFIKFGDNSWGKGYREKESNEFKELLSYSNEKIKNHLSQNKDNYLKTVFENINDENISQLQEKLDVSLPDRSSNYSFVPILTTVNGERLAESLLKLKNKNIDLFFYFLQRRYYPEKIYSNGYLAHFNAQDKDCLVIMKKCFEDRLHEFGQIKKYNLTNHIKFLGDLIMKLEELELNKDK